MPGAPILLVLRQRIFCDWRFPVFEMGSCPGASGWEWGWLIMGPKSLDNASRTVDYLDNEPDEAPIFGRFAESRPQKSFYLRALSLAMTFFSWSFLNSDSLLRRSASVRARICTAKTAAFLAPAFPMAMLATGTPGGI